MGYFSEENMNQVNNKMQFYPVVCIIIWPYVKPAEAEAPGEVIFVVTGYQK